jgi:hypothetical protein
MLVAGLRGQNADWATGMIAGGLMLAFSVWMAATEYQASAGHMESAA